MKKLALCVGINKYGSGSDLSECVNDAHGWTEAATNWAATMTGQGFEVTTLLDGDATRKAILAHLTAMIKTAKKNDSLLFTFSGHGTQVPDENGDEEDGYDECLCPADCMTTGALIFDDELWKLFRSKQNGVQLVMISDSCHSGTVARKIGPPIVAGPVDAPAQRRYLPYQRLPERAWKGVTARTKEVARMMEEGSWLKEARGAEKVPWPVCLIAGCQDKEYSYDAPKLHNGAFTHFMLQGLKNMKRGSTWKDLFLWVRDHALPSAEYPQTPRLIGSFLSKPILS